MSLSKSVLVPLPLWFERAPFTHPDCAKPLVDPPFRFAGRRVKAIRFFRPLSAGGEERARSSGLAMTG